MSEFRVVAEQNERRRIDGDLICIDDFESPVVEFGGRIHVLGIQNDFIQNRSRDSALSGFIGLLDGWENILDSPARLCRNVNDLGKINELEAGLNLLGERFLGLAFGGGVPFVDDDDNALLCL